MFNFSSHFRKKFHAQRQTGTDYINYLIASVEKRIGNLTNTKILKWI